MRVVLDANQFISGDEHLKQIKNYMNIGILPPAKFLKDIMGLIDRIQ
jgi:hypothetical protein